MNIHDNLATPNLKKNTTSTSMFKNLGYLQFFIFARF